MKSDDLNGHSKSLRKTVFICSKSSRAKDLNHSEFIKDSLNNATDYVNSVLHTTSQDNFGDSGDGIPMSEESIKTLFEKADLRKDDCVLEIGFGGYPRLAILSRLITKTITTATELPGPFETMNKKLNLANYVHPNIPTRKAADSANEQLKKKNPTAIIDENERGESSGDENDENDEDEDNESNNESSGEEYEDEDEVEDEDEEDDEDDD